ncbi:hypothetical protein BJX66DRAFT_314985 [Aspergillus keveii]|uniref:Integral membrane protein n=1 Tax=Aspergillus keveii TaxID=714993 RepID=A0ABR4FQ77_9EURO
MSYPNQYRPPPPPPSNILDDPDVITYCPGEDTLLCTAYWYTAPDAPRYEICSHCFASHIRNTPWASRFQRQLKPSDPDRHCRFDTPRMLTLWPQVLRNNDWTYISQFMARRAAIPHCKKLTPVPADIDPAGNIRRCYSLRNREIDDWTICAACYEDVVLATSFAGFFGPHRPSPPPPAGQTLTWTCDMTKHARRAIGKYAATNDWTRFVRSLAHAARLPPCEKAAGVAATSRKWFRPRPPIPDMVVCDACYYAHIAESFMENHFEPVPANTSTSRLETWVCDMVLVPMRVAQMKAEQDKDYQIFWNAARTIMANPPCPSGEGEGSYGGILYSLRGTSGKVCVCAQCYAGILSPYGFGGSFDAIQPSSQGGAGASKLCIFNEKSPRRAQYMDKLDEAVNLRTLTPFQTFASRLGVLPTCPTTTAVPDRKWYGNDDCLICESCWEEFAKETSLAPQLPYQGKVLPGGYCDLYSARMRGLWAKACAKGSMDEFMAFARHRSAVYQQTVPRMQEILAVMRMRLQKSQAALLTGVRLMGSDLVVAASQASGYSYWRYGNASVGYGWATRAGAHGQQIFNEGMGMNVADGGVMEEIARLEKMWMAVE